MTKEELDILAATVCGGMVICHKEVLTLDEAAQYTGMSKSALYKLTSNKQIPYSKPNGKNCFFRRTELEEWLMGSPVATDAELNAKALAYCMKNK